VQEAWLQEDVAQCGFCQPGQIMAAVALLKRTSDPTDEDIDAIQNVCRCGSYFRIREAIKAAAAMMSREVAAPVTEVEAPEVAPGQLPATGLGPAAAVGAAALAAAALAQRANDATA
jgi:xanthine dehydrogenase iron-sulfur cluster and FAD-binding subunit A